MEDYRLEQSGQEVQDILNGAAMQSDLTAETERATEAEQTLQGNIDAEATRAQDAEGTLQDNIDAEEARAKAAEKQNADDIDAIEEKIPSGASLSNKLATEEYVADAVATATATFRGTYNLVSDLHLNVTATEQQIAAALSGAISTADNNDYCFIQVPTSSETPTEIKEIDRYKFNGTAWAFEYKLNNSGFTAAQWAAINSGITSGDVGKLAALPTNAQLTTLLAGLQSDIDGEETRAKAAELALQGNIDSEEARAKAAEKQNADDIDAIEAVIPESASSENKVATKSEIDSLSAAIEAILLLIPSAATSLNKLADKAYVNSSIATATATFRGTYNLVNDLGLTTSATHAQIATALAGAILTADNNDYAFVQIPTSDAMPTEIAKTERYKFNGTAWEYEYDLNNSGFTADQWAAINSGITQALVTKLMALPTNAELTTELGTLTSSITAINQKIPNAASQANKLVDTAAMESYIVQVLDVLTISYNVTSTDGHVTLSIEQVDGKITSVTLTTSDIASAAALNLKASQADLTALASRVTTAEGNITSLGGRVTTAEGNITSLGGRVSTNETDIANLQQLYNDLQQSKPEPVTALPSTGQQQGVIYRLAGTTSYSDYMWNGSTWVLMATYNNAIDPRPKKASQNLVTSGGVFDNMGALDVSELNATENPHTLAQYVDLSAALAAIPTDYQKGGMSIKFVQSSDNKYVQYRLMAQSFTTDTTEWQGVDEEPTAGSDNLVKSGGVFKSINLLDIQNLSTRNKAYIDYGHLVNAGENYNYTSNVSWDAAWIQIFGNGNLVISGNTIPRRITFFNSMTPSSQTFLETSTDFSDINGFLIPTGAKLAIINYEKASNPNGYDSLIVYQDNSCVYRKEFSDAFNNLSLDALSSKNKALIDYGHIANAGENFNYTTNLYYDAGWVKILGNGNIKINGDNIPKRIVFYASLEPSSVSYISSSIDFSNINGIEIPNNAKLAIINFEKSANPDGYDNLSVVQDYSSVINKDINNDIGRQSKVLLIGSSFGVNTIIQYPFFCKSAGINVVCGMLYRGGCTFSDMVEIINGTKSWEKGYLFDIMNNWSENTSNFEAMLKLIDWDTIIINRGATDRTSWNNTMADDLQTVIEYIQNNVSNSPKILFTPGFAYPAYTLDKANQIIETNTINTTALDMQEMFGLEIIPVATTLQNARMTSVMGYGTLQATPPDMAMDGLHLDFGVGCYLTGALLFEWLVGERYNMSVINSTYIPSESEIAFIKPIFGNNIYTQPTSENMEILKYCVLLACRKPFEVNYEIGTRFPYQPD